MQSVESKVALTFAIYRGESLVSRGAVRQDVVKIGSDPRSHLRVDDELAARMHAVVEVSSPTDLTLIDLGDDGGTFVNGQRINKCKLAPGDRIRIGQTELVLENAQRDAPAPVAAANPFLAPNPFAGVDPFSATRAAPWGAIGSTPTPTPTTTATRTPTATAIDAAWSSPWTPADVEHAHVDAIEMRVLWGSNVLHVEHLTPPRSFFIGDDGAEPSDFSVPAHVLGVTRAPVMVSHGGVHSLVALPNATGTITTEAGVVRSLEDAIRSAGAPSSEVRGGHEIPLTLGDRALMRLSGSELAFEVSIVRAGKAPPVGFFSALDPTSHLYTGLSAILHLSLVAIFAFFMPSMRSDDAEGINRDQVDAMKPYLASIAEREHERQDDPSSQEQTPANEGGGGQRAAQEEGALGSTVSHETGHHYVVKGPADNTDPHLARTQALLEMQTESMIGILAGGVAPDPNAPSSVWGRDEASGTDPTSALGNMWGIDPGESAGAGGLGLSGTGEGGGCEGGSCVGIGLGRIGTLGRGDGPGKGPGFGDGHGVGHGLPGGAHKPEGPRMRPEPITITEGRIPKEVIQRIVRQNFGRFRLCYENGLRGNPALQGRVSVKFVIDRNGAVALSADGGSDLPDQNVVSCVVRGFTNLSFPSPQGGVVNVVYPLIFTPGE